VVEAWLRFASAPPRLRVDESLRISVFGFHWVFGLGFTYLSPFVFTFSTRPQHKAPTLALGKQ
jgi:hypothetical protein